MSEWYDESRMKWCMFCGAKMDGGTKDETKDSCQTTHGTRCFAECC